MVKMLKKKKVHTETGSKLQYGAAREGDLEGK